MVLIPSNFDIFYQNIRGVRTKCTGFKENVYASIHKMCCLTETWLNDTIFSHDLFLTSYSVFRTDRDYLNPHTTRGGGVLIIVSNLLQGVMRGHDLETAKEFVWVDIPVSDSFNLLVLIGNHYFPPDCNVTIIDSYLKFLEQNLKAHEYRVIMVGDFNIPNYDRINGAPLPDSRYYNTIKGNSIHTSTCFFGLG
jgi:exonuclease III